MKKLIGILLFSIISATTFAQTQVKHLEIATPEAKVVGIVKFGYDLIAQLTYTVDGNDTLNTLFYIDQNYKQLAKYQSITFAGGEQARENLNKSLKAGFLPENLPQKNVVTFATELTVGDTDVMLSNFRSLKNVQVVLSTKDGHLFSLTEPQLDKLFGR